ncbi:MAG: tRNA pseudouridine(55) synthase TruB [Elainellaceae cyanobacterium]
MQGFLNLNKPAGLTSHDCVARVRKLLRMKRVGHGGTLDPAATGVLPIALGRATRLLQYLRHDKAYQATIRLGMQTTTDDLEGEILSETAVPWLALEQVQEALPQFQGTIQQIPPSYSAIQVGGKRLYELARAGAAVEAPVRTVEVNQIQVLDWRSGDFPELEVAIACGAGTYIRSIARDLGDRLKTGGTLANLIRTESSGFTLVDSLTLEALAEQIAAETFHPIPPETALHHLEAIVLSDAQAKRWSQGQRIAWEEIATAANPGLPATPDLESSKVYRIHHETRALLGIGATTVREGITFLAPRLVWE